MVAGTILGAPVGERIIKMHNVKTPYENPELLQDDGIDMIEDHVEGGGKQFCLLYTSLFNHLYFYVFHSHKHSFISLFFNSLSISCCLLYTSSCKSICRMEPIYKNGIGII